MLPHSAIFATLENHFDIVVIGGGAAGFFAAIEASAVQGASVCLLEKTSKLLSKVLVSGGGRCNVTHDCRYPSQLVKHYPRGGNTLKKAFDTFGPEHTIRWFESKGVPLKTESDGRMFPITDNSQTIADCLLHEAKCNKVEILTKHAVTGIIPQEGGGFQVDIDQFESIICRKVIVTTGGFYKAEGYHFLSRLGIEIAAPVPSLFTFNVPNSDLKDLMGLSVNKGAVQIPGTKWKQEGPLLITHWGFSAPAVIKLSAWAAIGLHSCGYHFPILINWTGLGEVEVRSTFQELRFRHPAKILAGTPCFDVPSRLWERLCEKAGVKKDLRHADAPAKVINLLVEFLVRSPYQVSGKTTYKEEFVTCGGVELNEVHLTTFESKKIPGLYFAGEVLNVDGITGGFNFQHAWTSGYLAGNHAGRLI